MSHSVELSL